MEDINKEINELIKTIYADRVKLYVQNNDISNQVGIVVNEFTNKIETSIVFTSEFTLEQLKEIIKNNL